MPGGRRRLIEPRRPSRARREPLSLVILNRPLTFVGVLILIPLRTCRRPRDQNRRSRRIRHHDGLRRRGRARGVYHGGRPTCARHHRPDAAEHPLQRAGCSAYRRRSARPPRVLASCPPPPKIWSSRPGCCWCRFRVSLSRFASTQTTYDSNPSPVSGSRSVEQVIQRVPYD
jgi:hypothetical protein